MFDPMIQIGGRDVGGGGEDCADVVEMFPGLAFAKEKQLVDDDGCGWRKPKGAEGCFDSPPLLKFPAREFGFSGKVAVGAQRAVLVDDVEMATGFPGDFSEEHFRRREIEILGREGANECGNVIGCKGENEVGIKGETGPSIGDCGEPSDQTITDARGFETFGKETNLLHGR